MKAKKLSYDDIEFINKCCNNKLFSCENCKYKFSHTYKTSTNTEIYCVCDLLYNAKEIMDFENIEEMLEIFNELGEEEIGDIE